VLSLMCKEPVRQLSEVKKNCKLVLGIVVFLSLIRATQAGIWYVHPDSSLNKIQAAIDSTAVHDTVLVGPGIYIENINFVGKAIVVKSECGPDTTIIDGGNPVHPDVGSVVTFTGGEDTTSILEGFTLTHGTGTVVDSGNYWLRCGAGIFCARSSPTIVGNIITDNTLAAPWVFGGGIYCYAELGAECSPVILDNTIANNTAVGDPYHACGGGGIGCDPCSSPIIMGNTIRDNQANTGGAIYRQYGACITVSNNIIVNNYAEYGGGGLVYWGDAPWAPFCSNCTEHGEERIDRTLYRIDGNTISGNTTQAYGGGIWCIWTSPLIRRNIISNNTASHGGGVVLQYSSAIVDSCIIEYNSLHGIYCELIWYYPAYPLINYNQICDNAGYGVFNYDSVWVNGENNWWGDATGPYHPTANPSGLGDTVSDYVDFDPWLTNPGIEGQPIVKSVKRHRNLTATIFRGSLQLPEGRQCKVYDITGRVMEPSKIKPGIYFIEVDGVVTQKVVKVR
jgi:hypothetical protein